MPPEQKTNELKLQSNIKLRPESEHFALPENASKKVNKLSWSYFFSWVLVATLSVAGLTMVVINEGGVENAIKTASFKNLNRQIARNNFAVGGDNFPTASIPTGGLNSGSLSQKLRMVRPVALQPILSPKSPTIISTPLNSEIKANNGARKSTIKTTYFSVFLGQSANKSAVINLWYEIKNKNIDLFSDHTAGYYYDAYEKSYNLVVGKFSDLSQSLKYCAELKFYDIACKYDSTFVNLQLTSIK